MGRNYYRNSAGACAVVGVVVPMEYGLPSPSCSVSFPDGVSEALDAKQHKQTLIVADIFWFRLKVELVNCMPNS